MTALLTWAETVFFRLAEMSGGAVACLVLSCAAWAIFYYLRCSKRIPYLLLLLVLARRSARPWAMGGAPSSTPDHLTAAPLPRRDCLIAFGPSWPRRCG